MEFNLRDRFNKASVDLRSDPLSKINIRESALIYIDRERNRQDAKWGEQNHAPEKWVGILGEEFGEYCQAVNETVFDNGPEARRRGGYENMMKELTHVAAVAVGAMEALMREEIKKRGVKNI